MRHPCDIGPWGVKQVDPVHSVGLAMVQRALSRNLLFDFNIRPDS
jgi:hypothetical protein